jgi:hypothetical protein
VLNLLEQWGNVISVHSDPRLQSVVFLNQASNFALTMLGQALLLREQIAKLIILVLK